MPETFDDDVIVVGGGAVGLFLGCRLAQLGVSVRVLERRTTPAPHSRAIGVHPPSLERLAVLGLANSFVQEGVQVTRGHAYAGTKHTLKHLGTLPFAVCPPPYSFILTLPQPCTEALLATRLDELSPEARFCGAEVVRLETDPGGVAVNLKTGETLRSRFLVAADGKDSFIRQTLGIPFPGKRYPDTYVMGDFADTTALGSDAGLYFTHEGLVESFPLPGGVRRWVVKTPQFVREPTLEQIARLVGERLGAQVSPETNTMVSSFGVQRFLAERFTSGRVALVGDAAHVLSPIGGQGMNLGFLGAWRLAESLARGEGFGDYDAHRNTAKNATLRAEFNTVMGRATPLAPLRDTFAWSILHTPLKHPFARAFTMRGL